MKAYTVNYYCGDTLLHRQEAASAYPERGDYVKLAGLFYTVALLWWDLDMFETNIVLSRIPTDFLNGVAA